MANPFLPRRFTQPDRKTPRRVGKAATRQPEELKPKDVGPSQVAPYAPQRTPRQVTDELQKPTTEPGPIARTPAATEPPPTPTPPQTPFLPGPYGADYVPRTGMSLDMLNTIAADPARAGELASILMNAQYGPGAPVSGMFGDYLRSQAGTLGAITQFLDTLGIGGGHAERGGPYRTFEDAYEGLGAGAGTARPGETSISDWRNLIYGGAGAQMPGGFLGGGERARALEPGSLAAARSYLEGNIHPLLGSTMSDTAWGTLQNLLPDLWTRYNQQTMGQANAPIWAQWLQQGGYLPSRAL